MSNSLQTKPNQTKPCRPLLSKIGYPCSGKRSFFQSLFLFLFVLGVLLKLWGCTEIIELGLIFRANPDEITEGESSEISWKTNILVECFLYEENKGLLLQITCGTSGTKTVSPSATTKYEVRCVDVASCDEKVDSDKSVIRDQLTITVRESTAVGACCYNAGYFCKDGMTKKQCETPPSTGVPGVWKGEGSECNLESTYSPCPS